MGLKHGEAISVGMVMEAQLSQARGLLQKRDMERIGQVLDAFNLPVSVKGDSEVIMDAILKDKKREDGRIHAILLDEIGKARLDMVTIKDIKEIVDDMCQHG
jgi:3-dehydroquinate synthase